MHLDEQLVNMCLFICLSALSLNSLVISPVNSGRDSRVQQALINMDVGNGWTDMEMNYA